MSTPTTRIRVAQMALSSDNVARYVECSVKPYTTDEGRWVYEPNHVDDTLCLDEGNTYVVEVSDHECPGRDFCEVEEIDLPDYTEE